MTEALPGGLDPISTDPINVQIYEMIRQRILEGVYPEYGNLPTELFLVDEFGVSRHTIRAAMQRLIVDGMIERRRGSGTVVLPRRPTGASWSTGSLDLMVAKQPKIELLEISEVLASEHAIARDTFRLNNKEMLFHVRTVMKSEGQPYFSSNLFTSVDYGRRIPRDQIGSEYFLTLLEKHIGLHAIRARQLVEAVLPTPDIAEILEVPLDHPLLLLHRTFYGLAGDPLQYVQMHVRPDTSPQITNFYRDEDIKD